MDTSASLQDDFAFGGTIVVPRRRELLYKGKKIEVGDRAFDLLLLLVECRGRILSKDSIIARVWPNRVIEDNTVEGQISALRKAIGDDRSVIRTVTGRGYQFTGELIGASPTAETPHTVQLKVADFPGVRLPADIGQIIGRQQALQDVTGHLAMYRLVSLVGTGGVGKTRLAFEAARQCSSHFDDGVFLAEFAATTSSDYLPTAIAVALGYPPGDGTPAFERLAPTLFSKKLLLVVDNCEHLVDAAARVVERLLRIAPRMSVLATSREPLRVSGEFVYRVPSLDIPPEDDCEDAETYGAIQLFEERGGVGMLEKLDRPTGFRLQSRICRQLDGIPLALELAAACVPVLGLQGTAERLENRFQILTQGSRTALPRQQTLRATLDWSYSFLTRKQQIVLNRLGTFAGTFTLEAAQGMATCPQIPQASVVETIIELVDKSLISVASIAGTVRYRLLESTRAYTKERVKDDGNQYGWSLQHAGFFLQIFKDAARRADTDNEVDWDAGYAEHLDDLRASIGWSFSDAGNKSLGCELIVFSVPLLMHLALLKECQSNVDKALAWLNAQDVPQDDRHMRLYAAQGTCLLCYSVASPTSDAFQLAVDVAAQVGDPGVELFGLWGRWMCHYLNGEFGPAVQVSRRFRHLSALSSRPCDRLASNRITGISLLFQGDIYDAIRELQLAAFNREPVSRAQRMRFLYDERMLSYAALSLALWFAGKLPQAREAAQQALAAAQELDHPVSICYALSEGLGTLALLCEDNDLLEHAVAALVIETRRHSISTWQARAQMWQGLLQMRAGDSSAYTQVVFPAMTNLGSKRFYISLTPYITAVSHALVKQGKFQQAKDLIADSLNRSLKTDDRCSTPELMRANAEILIAEDASEASLTARKILSDAIHLADIYGFVSWKLRCARTLAELGRRKGLEGVAADADRCEGGSAN